MSLSQEEEPDLSPTSPVEDSEDAALSPVQEPEPAPGLHGNPVRCMYSLYLRIPVY